MFSNTLFWYALIVLTHHLSLISRGRPPARTLQSRAVYAGRFGYSPMGVGVGGKPDILFNCKKESHQLHCKHNISRREYVQKQVSSFDLRPIFLTYKESVKP